MGLLLFIIGLVILICIVERVCKVGIFDPDYHPTAVDAIVSATVIAATVLPSLKKGGKK